MRFQLMKISVKLFALYHEIIGKRVVILEIPINTTIRDLKSILVKKNPELKKYETSFIFTINNNYAKDNLRLKAGDKIAVFPSVSGG